MILTKPICQYLFHKNVIAMFVMLTKYKWKAYIGLDKKEECVCLRNLGITL